MIAEDGVLMREGLRSLLAGEGHDVVAQVGDADALRSAVRELRPELAIIDVRMPPTQTDEGARAAVELRAEQPELAVLLLSQDVETRLALTLMEEQPSGFGYLLKDRVLAIDEFLDAVERVGRGGSAIDPEVVLRLMDRRDGVNRLSALTPRERELLALIAEGHSNASIGKRLFLSQKTIDTHIHSILGKLGLPATPDQNRRVLAVLAYLGRVASRPRRRGHTGAWPRPVRQIRRQMSRTRTMITRMPMRPYPVPAIASGIAAAVIRDSLGRRHVRCRMQPATQLPTFHTRTI